MIVVANQVTIGFARTHLFQSPFFAHFKDSRRRNKKRGVSGPRRGSAKMAYRVLIFFWILKFAVNCFYSSIEYCLQLCQIAHKNDQLRTARRRRRNGGECVPA